MAHQQAGAQQHEQRGAVVDERRGQVRLLRACGGGGGEQCGERIEGGEAEELAVFHKHVDRAEARRVAAEAAERFHVILR
jgi:hypothetical protein